jgi:putative lipase involved disintegration of autophagic bodies
MKMIRWVGFPIRCLLFALALLFVIPLTVVFWPDEWDWYDVRKDWHRWVLKDYGWRDDAALKAREA